MSQITNGLACSFCHLLISPVSSQTLEKPSDADGKRFGDWEMDLIVGPRRSAALTMIERSTNYLIIRKLPQRYKSEQVSKAIIDALKPYKKNVMTITTDNGPEFAQYKEIEQKLQCEVYYAKPYAPWQKGAVENANMLIRQYVPKGFNINTMSIQYLAYIQNKINSRPREKLMFKSPIFVFNLNSAALFLVRYFYILK